MIGGRFKDVAGRGAVEIPPFELLAADRQYPLSDAEVYRVMKAAREAATDSILESSDAVTFEIAFGEGTIVAGAPIVPTLGDLIDHAIAVVEPLVSGVE